MLEMRKTYIRYQNEEDQSREAEQRYREQRNRARELMRETFDAADKLLFYQFDQEAITFIGTMVQHHEKNDIYDEATMRAATQLIDGGRREMFLFLAAIRSAVVAGDFDLAKRLFDHVGEE